MVPHFSLLGSHEIEMSTREHLHDIAWTTSMLVAAIVLIPRDDKAHLISGPASVCDTESKEMETRILRDLHVKLVRELRQADVGAVIAPDRSMIIRRRP